MYTLGILFEAHDARSRGVALGTLVDDDGMATTDWGHLYWICNHDVRVRVVQPVEICASPCGVRKHRHDLWPISIVLYPQRVRQAMAYVPNFGAVSPLLRNINEFLLGDRICH